MGRVESLRLKPPINTYVPVLNLRFNRPHVIRPENISTIGPMLPWLQPYNDSIQVPVDL